MGMCVFKVHGAPGEGVRISRVQVYLQLNTCTLLKKQKKFVHFF